MFYSIDHRETHIKTMTRCHCTPVRAEIQITDTTRFGDDVEQHERRCWWEYDKGTDRNAGEQFCGFPQK